MSLQFTRLKEVSGLLPFDEETVSECLLCTFGSGDIEFQKLLYLYCDIEFVIASFIDSTYKSLRNAVVKREVFDPSDAGQDEDRGH